MRTDYDRSEAAGASGDINLSDIAHALSRKRWWVIIPTLTALVGAIVFVNVVKPRYTAEARVLLENQENYLTRGDKNDRIEPLAPDPEAVGSQIQLVTSRDLARRVIKTLNLQGNPEFDPLAEGVSPLTRILVTLGLSRDPTRLSPEERILEAYFERLSVYSPTKTRVLLIEFTSRDPDLAARAANAIADAYIDMQQEAKREQARYAAQSLGKLVSELQTRVSEAESRAEAFRSKMGLLVGSNNTTIATQQLGELNNQLSISQVAQADALAKANLIRDLLHQHRIGDIPDVANNELIRRIAERRIALSAQLALESRTLLGAHPRIKELRAELAKIDAEARQTAERVARTLENDARIAGARVENLKHVLEEQKKVASTAGSDEVRLRELERVARLLKEQLESDTAKYQEALARESVKASPADARIVQRALAPQTPSFPKKLPITLFSMLAAFVLSAGGIVAGELLSDRQRPRRDLGPAAPTPPSAGGATLGPSPETPKNGSKENLAAESGAPSSGALGSAIESRPRPWIVYRSSPQLLLPSHSVTSSESKDSQSDGLEPNGETSVTQSSEIVSGALTISDVTKLTTNLVKVLIVVYGDAEPAVELARALSRRGRAILAAAHLDDVAYDRLVGAASAIERPKGFSDLIAGTANFADVIYRDAGSRLHVLPAGAGEGVTQYKSPLAVDALALIYDFVIFATSSLERARELAPLFDTILVRGEGEDVETARAELLRAGAKNVSILTNTDEAQSELFAA